MTTGHPDFVGVAPKQLLDVLIGQAINANSSITRPASGFFSIYETGYEIQLNVGSIGNPSPIVSVELQWYDSTFGALMDSEIYYFYSGNVNGHQIHGRGPTKGDRLLVIISNNGGSQVTVSYTLLQTGRAFTREFWKTIGKAGTQPGYIGLTAANSSIAANQLASEIRVLAASTGIGLVLPLYTGRVSLFATTTDAAVGNSSWTLTSTSDHLLPGSQIIVGRSGQSGFTVDGATSLYVPEMAMPRAQCQLNLQNGNAGAGETLTAVITAQEDRA